MPLTPKFTYEETEGGIEVYVDIPGVKKQSLDILLTECYLKVNFPPYLFHVDLHGEVDESRSAAMVEKNKVTFRLVKNVSGLWGKLHSDLDKKSLAVRREASVEAYRERAMEVEEQERCEVKVSRWFV